MLEVITTVGQSEASVSSFIWAFLVEDLVDGNVKTGYQEFFMDEWI